VYQAYNDAIADAALAAGRFVAPFKVERMTWIKPSFLWMAYRSGWATKPAQERVLAIEMTHEGFEWALTHASLSAFEPDTYATRDAWLAAKERSPVRIQWDPERDLLLQPLAYRAIQIGLSGEAVKRYVAEWILGITDVTPTMRAIKAHLDAGDRTAAAALLPEEPPLEVARNVAAAIGMTVV
jgi:hypothetical protein